MAKATRITFNDLTRVVELDRLIEGLGQTPGPQLFCIDLFSGAGGTTTGLMNSPIKVVACVNHDNLAIASHAANHPDILHFNEDILDYNVVLKLKSLVNTLKVKYPDCKIMIWASIECTNFSKAKGGRSRDADSRTLACGLFSYLDEIQPDFLTIENVVEFQDWGPLDEDGHPLAKLKGTDYQAWVMSIVNRGYQFDSRKLNSKNYGAYTSRERLFIQFSKSHKIYWPHPTHGQMKKIGLFDTLQPLKAVKDVINHSLEGKSIFSKTYSDNTLKKILRGLEKFVTQGTDEFIIRYNGNLTLVDESGPSGTITTVNRFARIEAKNKAYLICYNKGEPMNLDGPAGTITTKDRFGRVNCFVLGQQSGDDNVTGADVPFPTLTTIPGQRVARIIYNYGHDERNDDLDGPVGTITTVPKISVVKYLINDSYSNGPISIEKPSPTVIANQKSWPLRLVQFNQTDIELAIEVFEDDTEVMVEIKKYMAAFGILDITIRMLTVNELKLIQGFPEGYILLGPQDQQKKFIGNSVEVNMAAALGNIIYKSCFYER